jgi:acetoin utilization deacetylase AcuC-like enzyme
VNLPLPFGADDATFIAANTRLCDTAKAHGAEALILPAGWDAHRDDPVEYRAFLDRVEARE